ncbi:Glucuronoxylan 4-O-methyltransferase 2 [Linum perenne]
MRPKIQQSAINPKLIFLSFFFLCILFLVLWSTFSSPNSPSLPASSHVTSSVNQHSDSQDAHPACPSTPAYTCTKAPPSLANALVHYATTNITPQQTLKEVSVSLRILEKKSPCNFLIFGLGHDSLMWSSLNYGGRTVFLEEDKTWIEKVVGDIPSLEAYHVSYDTKVHQAGGLMEAGIGDEDCKAVSDPRESKCRLALKGFPAEIYEMDWDLIMVDAPTGYHDEAPGRMTAIYTAGMMARNKEAGETQVFVHDVDRTVEDRFSKAFLCEGYLTEQEGRLRHFTIPSHRARPGRPFCP